MKGYKYREKDIQAVLEKTDLVALVGESMPLAKGDKAFHGICPFDKENEDSFYITPKKQTFHCFCCGVNGNALSFIMKKDNLPFPKALEVLAKRADIPVPKPVEKELEYDKETLYKINKEAAIYYHKELTESDNPGKKYCTSQRQLSKKTIKFFAIGYAKSGKQNLYNYLLAKGYKKEDMILAGLVREDEKRGPCDVFWNRIIFPIIDTNREIIGFGGRTLDTSANATAPKYLNTKETPIFLKKYNLFGLNIAKEHTNDGFIICEGYMDVVAMHQAGFKNSVASLGTAFTDDQAKIIKHFLDTSENGVAYLAYDSDDAGIKATISALELMGKNNIPTKVINLAPCKDPDEFIKANGLTAFKERICDAKDGVVFRIEQIAKQYISGIYKDSKQKRESFLEDVAKVIDDIQIKEERNKIIAGISRKYGISEKSIREQLNEETLIQGDIRDAFHEQLGTILEPAAIVFSNEELC